MDISFCLPRTRRGRAEHSRTRNARHALASRVLNRDRQTNSFTAPSSRRSGLPSHASEAPLQPHNMAVTNTGNTWHKCRMCLCCANVARGRTTQRVQGRKGGRQELIPRNPRSQGCGQAPVDAAPEDDNVTGSGWCVGARGKGQWRAVQCLAPWISLEGQAPCCQNHSFVWLGCGSLTPLVGWLAPPVQPRAPAPRWLTIPATRTHDVFVVPDGCGVKQTRAPQQRDKGGQSDGDQVNPSPCTSCQFKAP
jgi:hypothetical protein